MQHAAKPKKRAKKAPKSQKAPAKRGWAYTALITISVICLVASAVLAYYTVPCIKCGEKFCLGDCPIPERVPAGEVTSVNRNEDGELVYPTQLQYTGAKNQEYLDDLIFIGDSRTVGFQLVGIPASQTWAETGMFHMDALTKKLVVVEDIAIMTIPEALTAFAPKVAIVNFGINGFGYMDDDAFYEEYKEMMEGFIQASPKTAFVIESILPVSLTWAAQNGYTNEEIDEMNARLLLLAEELGCYYLDTASAMKDGNNALERSYSSGDGLHFSQTGSQAILAHIATHRVPTWRK